MSKRIAIVGATLIDGHGGKPVPDSAVLVAGSKIVARGRRGEVERASEAETIDATGKFLVPGFTDTNVHIAPFKRLDELIRYEGRYADVALEAAQMMLRSGITTIRDSYGILEPLLATRDAIRRGDEVGPRLYVAGNIVGWGALGSRTFDCRGPSMVTMQVPDVIDTRTPYFLERVQDEFTQGVGEELIDMEPAELRAAINSYLDKGVDFVKYGATGHLDTPSMIVFSERAQQAIVEEVHRRGKVAETHALSPEGVRMALLAGVDLVQHPEILDVPISDELVEMYVERGVICSMNVNWWTGDVWADYLSGLERFEREQPLPDRPLTGLERRIRMYRQSRQWWRENAKKLIAAGCTVSTASDSLSLPPPDLMRGTEPFASVHNAVPGHGTLKSIEGLVEVGMTPMQALVAATKNAALASKALDEYGTIDPDKSADLLLLDEDPLLEIRNIRKVSMVMARGKVIDLTALPTQRVYSRADPR